MEKIRRYILPLLFCVIFLVGFNIFTMTVMAKEDLADYESFEAKVSKDIILVGKTSEVYAISELTDKKLKKVSYKSMNKKIATVNKNGKIIAVAAGRVKIKAYHTGYPDLYSYVTINVVNYFIKISGPSKYRVGKTYQLRASEKNVSWELVNDSYENAFASINSKTGKVKVTCAGHFYVTCKSNDKKALGRVDIYATGPVIKATDITHEPINIKEDEKIITPDELIESSILPDKISARYTDGNTSGKVDVKIQWFYMGFDDEVNEGDSYQINGFFDPPKGYEIKYDDLKTAFITVKVNFLVQQSDTRKNIISIKPIGDIIISKDEHICDDSDVFELLKKTKLVCTLENGEVVNLPVNNLSYSNTSLDGKPGKYYFRVGTSALGYKCSKEVYSNLTLIIKKKQSHQKKSSEISNDTDIKLYCTQHSLGI